MYALARTGSCRTALRAPQATDTEQIAAVRLSGASDKLLYATPVSRLPARHRRTIHKGERPMKTSHAGVMLAAALILISGPAISGDDPKVAAEIMALARAQWAAEAAGKSAAEQSAATADDYTEFNPDFPARIEGKTFAIASPRPSARTAPGRSWEKWRIRKSGLRRYRDPFVQLRRAQQGQGRQDHAEQREVDARAISKMNGKWMLVHANFAPVVMP